MKVDELLEKSILTPRFTCTALKPKAENLNKVSHGSLDFIFAEVKAPYTQQNFDLESYMKTTDSLTTEILETDNIKMLIAFLKFAEGAKSQDGQHTFLMKDIYDFIYAHGFPVTQVFEFTEEKAGHEKLLGLDLNSFIQRLDNLYVCYALWKALQINDYDLIQRIQPRPLTKEEMQLKLEHRLIPRINITVLYYDGKPVLTYQADNIMALVEAQLAVLASKGDDYLDGGCIAYCADCCQPFIKYRSNSTLCEKCKGNTGKSRRYRAKKKGDQNNG